MNDRSDENLVAASCKGDRAAYTLLVKRHYKQVFIVSLGVVGNVQDAEDVAQEAMLKAFTEISRLRKGAQFGPWISRIAKNLCINLVRRKQRARQIITENVGQPNGAAIRNESLQWAIGKLPLEMRLPLVMYYLDGQSVKAVAEKLDVSSSGVYLKLRTALNELHRLLTEHGETDG